MADQIQIVYKPTIETLMKVSRHLLLNLRLFRIIPFIFVFVFLITYCSNYMSRPGHQVEYSSTDFLSFLIYPAVLVFAYFRMLATMKKNILNNKRNFETQKIIFSSDSYIQEGETFKVTCFWNETYQIKETEDWFLIYTKKNSALPIVKSDLTADEYRGLKTLFYSLDIKKKLK